MSKRAITIDLDHPNLEWVENPEHLESSGNGLSRFLIPDSEQSDIFAESEWFCDDCGGLVEDTFEGCENCAA